MVRTAAPLLSALVVVIALALPACGKVLPPMSSSDAQGLLLNARTVARSHDSKRCVELASVLLDRAPANAQALRTRAQCNLAQGHWVAAETDYTALLTVDQADTDARLGRARAYGGLGRAALAYRDITEVVARPSASRSDVLPAVSAFIDLGFFVDADSTISASLKRWPDDSDLYLEKADMERRLNNTEATLAALDRAVQIAPERNHDWPVESRATFLRSIGRDQDAVRDYTAVLRSVPDSVSALMGRASAYDDLGRLALAETDLTKAINLQTAPVPSPPDTLIAALTQRAMLMLRVGRTAEARTDLERARGLVPPSDSAQRGHLQALIDGVAATSQSTSRPQPTGLHATGSG
jgi:tetratricopeptide (TPR) repeat protein